MYDTKTIPANSYNSKHFLYRKKKKIHPTLLAATKT